MRFWLPILVPSAPYCSASSSHLHCRASRVARNQAKVGAAASEPAEPEPLSLALALALALSCSLMPPSGLPPPATNSSPCFGLAVGKRRRYGGMFCCGALGEGLVDLCQGPDVVRADADESFGQETSDGQHRSIRSPDHEHRRYIARRVDFGDPLGEDERGKISTLSLSFHSTTWVGGAPASAGCRGVVFSNKDTGVLCGFGR